MRIFIVLLALFALVHAQNPLSRILRTIPNHRNTELNQKQINAVRSYIRLASIAACSRMQTGQVFKQARECSLTTLCTDFENVKVLDKFDRAQTGDIGGYLARDDKRRTLIVSFQGTSSFKNIMTDLTANEVKHPDIAGAEVHRGFYNAAIKAKNYLLPKIKHEASKMGAMFREYEIEVIGHSLGGAVATLFTAELVNHGPKSIPNFNKRKIVLVTLGEPRVGDRKFVQFINQQPFLQKRVTNRDDPVPFLPFKPVFARNSILLESIPNYESRDFEIHAHNNGKVIHCISANDSACESDKGAFRKIGSELLDLAKSFFKSKVNLDDLDHFEFGGVITGCPTDNNKSTRSIGDTTLLEELLMQLGEIAEKDQKDPKVNTPKI
ncbi:uncharacterized protein VTP21DRAFT_723 [Calcarisporiella thermophila]|uniref:uncharacterized protein n=1 Tax=Calcarisporiella thermophila TaxID=911321 RepID=UPI0037442558